MIGRLAAFFLLSAIVAQAAEIKGKITSVVGGEGLGRVQVSVLEAGVATTTSVDGAFVIQNLAPGNYTLRLNAVGYRLVTLRKAPVTSSFRGLDGGGPLPPTCCSTPMRLIFARHSKIAIH